jgi:hypothetical protein
MPRALVCGAGAAFVAPSGTPFAARQLRPIGHAVTLRQDLVLPVLWGAAVPAIVGTWNRRSS